MNVDAYDAELKAQADSDDIGEDLGKAQQAVQTAATPHAHWKLWFSWEAHYYIRCFT